MSMEDGGGQSEERGGTASPIPPSLALPKGGGAVRGIGEKFATNPVTGTGTLTMPVYASPGRSGMGPQFALSYDSGAGNSPFGLGWNLSLPGITRKTDKGLPRYRDQDESDTFILSGAEDLVPLLVAAGESWIRQAPDTRTVFGRQYMIHRYRPRGEGLFARIERWINVADPADTFWRSISKDNITTWYGKTVESRIADPEDPARVFSWLICETHDDKGNVVVYQYKPEDSAGVDLSKVHERNRSDVSRSAQRYIKSVLYGNRTPYFPNLSAAEAVAQPSDWCFQLVFDYGEHNLSTPIPSDTAAPWACRLDPFSSYRACFEIRTYRLCRRVLMFHHFADQPAVGLDCLVRSTDLQHALTRPADPAQPFYSYLLSATQTGYVRQSTGYLASSMPPLEFEYTQAAIDETVRDVDSKSLRNLPDGLAASQSRWVDLDGEGVSGVLSEQEGNWYYKPNLSPANLRTIAGEALTLPQFGALQRVGRQPSPGGLSSGSMQLMDLSGDGKLAAVTFEGPCPGYFERTEEADWEPFRTFSSVPRVDWRSSNLKFVDLTGDGFPDLLIGEDAAFWWHPSLSVGGFGPAQRVAQALDEEKGPKLVFADSTETVFLADLSGDGLTDLVRIRNGEVCYWPNLGYGLFGAKVTMDGSPRLDNADLFDGRRIRLADIDGSGTVDIVYFADNAIHLYFNQSGNAWGGPRSLTHFPVVENISSATAIDLLGTGTACLVWSSPLPGAAQRPMRYIDLMGGQKPHLLVRSRNNLGAETVVQYAPSTRFYVADKLAGTPWLTRLPFPVHVVERVETYDYISRNRFVTRCAYHHGYYDGVEREFRGFGRVDQWDTEEFGVASGAGVFPLGVNEDPASSVPPMLTTTWFHTGAYFGESVVSRQFADEYYDEGDASEANAGLTSAQLAVMRLDDTILPTTLLLADGTRLAANLSPEELREASRALRGSILRQEVYGLDGTDLSDRPYIASEHNYTLEVLQPQGPNQYGVFLAHARESIDFHYERMLLDVVNNTLADPAAPPADAVKAADPRVTHAITLAVDPYGNILQGASIAYGRRFLDPVLMPADQVQQSMLRATCVTNLYTNPILADDHYRAPHPAESSSYELIQLQPEANAPGLTNLFRFDELQAKTALACDGAHDIAYENLTPTGLTPGQPYRRQIDCARTHYRPDDLGAAAGDPKTLLPLSQIEPLALPGASYKLAFTAELITQVYQRGGTPLLPTPAVAFNSIAPDGGGYVDLDGDGRWWIPSGRSYFTPSPTTPALERAEAVEHFFLARRFEDPFGHAATVAYDAPNDLLVVQTTDPLGNTASAVNDYRVLAPAQLTDPNGNRSEVAFDALGLVAGSAVMGKTTENVGDSVVGFVPDLDPGMVDAFFTATDPHTIAAGLLGHATTRIVYDIHRFYDGRLAAPSDPAQWRPVFAATLARETHVSDLGPGQTSKIQIVFGYSDGFGREIQRKAQAEPGPTPLRDSTGAIVVGTDGQPELTTSHTNPRWVGSGWTVFNNKGKPVRQFEPFFTDTHDFEFDVRIGISPVLFYDPLGRVVATLHPNHTYTKVLFDPWRQQSWDGNDTVLLDPATDADVSAWFGRLDPGECTPSWYALRTDPADASLASQRWPDPTLRAAEVDAAHKTEVHAATPGIAHADTLGRTFLTVAHNRFKYRDSPPADPPVEEFNSTRIVFDVEGNQREVIDARNRVVMRYDYDMLGTRIHQASMEAGERWMLSDVTGKPIYAWDSRGHSFRSEYDALRRPVRSFVTGADPQHPDTETCVQASVYGEQASDAPPALNLRGRLLLHCDTAGIVVSAGTNPQSGEVEAYDFKGNPLRGSRQLLRDYKNTPDWDGVDWNAVNTALAADPWQWANLLAPFVSMLESESFASSAVFDALNRTIGLTTPDASIYRPVYNEANLLHQVSVNLRGATAATAFVADIDYDAKGRRTRIDYGNGAGTGYRYDPLTLRLSRLTTTRPAGLNGLATQLFSNASTVQDLAYTYDPSGNITRIADRALPTLFFNNASVDPESLYSYDAVYRLIEATGRESIGQSALQLGLAQTTYRDYPFAGLGAQPFDPKAVRSYRERYDYDGVGNFLHMIHRAQNGTWQRDYNYDIDSLIELGTRSNRLSSTVLHPNGSALTENYTYDAHGNMASMPHLTLMQWDFRDQLQAGARQVVNDGTPESTWYVYDAGGQRARKVTERQNGTRKTERIYLGGYEVYREYGGDGITVSLERETLHVMDDKQRVALVETRTLSNEGTPPQLIRYQFGNHLGSASLELDEAGQLISYEEYTPYGGTSYQTGRSVAEVSIKRYRYTGLERDEETGFNYHSARYYATWLGSWTSCDPKYVYSGRSSDSESSGNESKIFGLRSFNLSSPSAPGAPIPDVSSYVYCSANPVRYVDLDGKDTHWWDLAWFRIRHPTLSREIGAPEGRSGYNSRSVEANTPTLAPNISTLAARFSEYLPVGENAYAEGSNTNAIRHAIWQGLITRDFSVEDAKLAGDLHELHPGKGTSVRHFENPSGTKDEGKDILDEADETIDLLNNERARSFYNDRPSRSPSGIPDNSNKGIVRYYLGIFRYNGLYVADITHGSGHIIRTVDIRLNHLDEQSYVQAMRSLGDLSEIGLKAPRQAAAEKAAREGEEWQKQADQTELRHPWHGMKQ
jgi:RHS repeat-associated protein